MTNYCDEINLVGKLSVGQGIPGPPGPQGPPGQNGKDGAIRFEDLDESQIAQLKGEKGDQGPRGLQGLQGPEGKQGIQGIQGEKGKTGDIGPKGDMPDMSDYHKKDYINERFLWNGSGRIRGSRMIFDADTWTNSGHTNTDEQTANLPDTNKVGILFYMAEHNSSGVQYYYPTNSLDENVAGTVYLRNKIGNTWTKWKKILREGDIPKVELPKDILTEKNAENFMTNLGFTTVFEMTRRFNEYTKKYKVDQALTKDLLRYETFTDGARRQGGFVRLGDIGIEWRTNIKAASAAAHQPAKVDFSRLKQVLTIQNSIYGNVTGTVTCQPESSTIYKFWGSNDNIWFNTLAIGLAK